MARTRVLLPALILLTTLATAAPASAWRNMTHPDPVRVFKTHPFAPRHPLAHVSGVAFATAWPCTEQTSDRPPAISSNAPQVKVVYAEPSDISDQLLVNHGTATTYADLMQSDAQAVRNRMINPITGDPTGSAKTIRFDTGGTGGATCTNNEGSFLDIQTVALPHDHNYYNPPNDTFHRLTDDLKAALPVPSTGTRVNYVVYADRIQAAGASGQADILVDDSKTLESPINQGQKGNGRLFAVVYGDPNTQSATFIPNTTTSAPSIREATFMHELTHTLGGVQNSAPNSSHLGHCLDEQDIMCYDDDGSGPNTTHVACANGSDFLFTELYDCGGDDYWNPSPAAGSYLATHWDAYDSVFLCAASTECDFPLSPPGATTLSTTHPNGTLALAASTAGGTIAHYEWDINGDGFFDQDTGTTPSIAPTWNTPGPRTVHVRADKADGTFSLGSLSVTPAQPVPHFNLSGKFAAGQTLQLDGTATEDPDGLISQFVWDLDGDGSYETNTGLTRTASTSFGAPGSYSVGLEVDYPFGMAFSRTSAFSIAGSAASGTTGGTTTTTTTTTTVAGPSLALLRVNLKKLLASGLPLTIKCGASCVAKFTLAVDAKTAKKLHLKAPGGKPVKIGSLTGQFAAGTTKPSLKLTAAAKKGAKKLRSLTAKLAGSVTQGTSAPLKVTKTLTFKR